MAAKVSFRTTTFYKRPRGEAGLTRIDSQRMDAGRALGWVLGELPEDAYEMTFEGDDGHGSALKTTIVVHWDRVPAEISDGLS